jgi:hypothetical protein
MYTADHSEILVGLGRTTVVWVIIGKAMSDMSVDSDGRSLIKGPDATSTASGITRYTDAFIDCFIDIDQSHWDYTVPTFTDSSAMTHPRRHREAETLSTAAISGQVHTFVYPEGVLHHLHRILECICSPLQRVWISET